VIFEALGCVDTSSQTFNRENPGWSARRLLLIGFVVFALLYEVALAQPRVEYRNRGDRYEGLRELPVSGYTIELLSFRALYEEPVPPGLPPQYRVRFSLDKVEPTYLIVREIENKYSYWLDNVTPNRPWASGFANVFEWPTKDVLLHISNLKLYDLGVTVRVGKATPALIERVAPAILYHSITPTSIGGYEFAFKTNATASLEFRIERSDGIELKTTPEPRALRKWSYGVPFRVKWDASNSDPGRYRLKVHGRVLENNETFTQEVEFIHQPKVR
jgi:hypothetical protein